MFSLALAQLVSLIATWSYREWIATVWRKGMQGQVPSIRQDSADIASTEFPCDWASHIHERHRIQMAQSRLIIIIVYQNKMKQLKVHSNRGNQEVIYNLTCKLPDALQRDLPHIPWRIRFIRTGGSIAQYHNGRPRPILHLCRRLGNGFPAA